MKSRLITILAVYVGVVNYYDPDRGFGEVAYEMAYEMAYERKTAMFTFSAIIPVEENRVLTRGQEVQCDVSDKGVVLWIKKTEHRK
jgi:cold shock CspA family protein